MAEEATAPLLHGLLDEIVLWQILVGLDPKSLLRCRAVRRAWRRATSTRRFLLAHHARQPTLPIIYGDGYRKILAFDHRAAIVAQLHTVTRLDTAFVPVASCYGLLVLSKCDFTAGSLTRRLSVCNPATRQHAFLRYQPWVFTIVGMYPHRRTGEYRLLLQRRDLDLSEEQIGCYVLPLGSDHPLRHIGCPEIKLGSTHFTVPVWARHSLHWYPVYCPSDSDPLEYLAKTELVIVFHTISELLRQMRAPLVPADSCIFEVDDTIGIYTCNKATGTVDIWVLQNYESEVWDLKYRVELPLAEIRGKLEARVGRGYWFVTVASCDGDVLLLVSFGHWLFYVDTDGELVASFKDFYACKHRLKQTLVPHDFFTTLKGCAADTSPFI